MIDDGFRTEFVALRDTVHAGFARMDRYFELQQAQHRELCGRVDRIDVRFDTIEARLDTIEARLDTIEARLDTIEARLDRLENEVRALRDWVTSELVDVRSELRLLRQAAEDREELRGDVAALEARVTRLEQKCDDRRD